MPSECLMSPDFHLFRSERRPTIATHIYVCATKVANADVKTVVTTLWSMIIVRQNDLLISNRI